MKKVKLRVERGKSGQKRNDGHNQRTFCISCRICRVFHKQFIRFLSLGKLRFQYLALLLCSLVQFYCRLADVALALVLGACGMFKFPI